MLAAGKPDVCGSSVFSKRIKPRPSRLRLMEKPARCAKVSMRSLLANVSPVRRRMPAAAAWRASVSSNSRARPRPCHGSATAMANSASLRSAPTA
jgi:hypothetical protein